MFHFFSFLPFVWSKNNPWLWESFHFCHKTFSPKQLIKQRQCFLKVLKATCKTYMWWIWAKTKKHLKQFLKSTTGWLCPEPFNWSHLSHHVWVLTQQQQQQHLFISDNFKENKAMLIWMCLKNYYEKNSRVFKNQKHSKKLHCNWLILPEKKNSR